MEHSHLVTPRTGPCSDATRPGCPGPPRTGQPPFEGSGASEDDEAFRCRAPRDGARGRAGERGTGRRRPPDHRGTDRSGQGRGTRPGTVELNVLQAGHPLCATARGTAAPARPGDAPPVAGPAGRHRVRGRLRPAGPALQPGTERSPLRAGRPGRRERARRRRGLHHPQRVPSLDGEEGPAGRRLRPRRQQCGRILGGPDVRRARTGAPGRRGRGHGQLPAGGLRLARPARFEDRRPGRRLGQLRDTGPDRGPPLRPSQRVRLRR